MEKTFMNNILHNPSNSLYQPSNLPHTAYGAVPPAQSGQLDIPFPSEPCPENGHLHPDGWCEPDPNELQNVESSELEHTCLYHSILDKLDRDESLALEEVDRLSNLRESLSDPTVQKVLELLEYVNG